MCISDNIFVRYVQVFLFKKKSPKMGIAVLKSIYISIQIYHDYY